MSFNTCASCTNFLRTADTVHLITCCPTHTWTPARSLNMVTSVSPWIRSWNVKVTHIR